MTRSLRAARLALGLLACLACGTLAAEAHAQGKKSDSVVKVTAAADKPDAAGKQVVTITIDIEKPWHLYANPVGQADLADAQTVVNITSRAKPEEVKIDYPKGTLEKDDVVGNYMIYEDKVVIKATVRRAKGDDGPLKVAVKLQACGKKGCLLPATAEVTVP